MSLFDIDLTARAKARASIVISAPRDAVWALIADPETWPNWNGGVEWVGAVGHVTVGTRFEWRAGGMTIRSTVQALDAPGFIGWTGASTVISARRVWCLTAEGASTRVETAESFRGAYATFLPGHARRTIQSALEQGLVDLKSECEGRRPRLSRRAA
ncbi:MAG: SRPBCC family protein [Rhodobacteraceae bacterium]|nr:SRPBCC family protein [Paracoccaceae bacterium]